MLCKLMGIVLGDIINIELLAVILTSQQEGPVLLMGLEKISHNKSKRQRVLAFRNLVRIGLGLYSAELRD